MSELRELAIGVNDVDKDGIYFMCHDNDGGSACYVTFTSKMARELAIELLEAADELDSYEKLPAGYKMEETVDGSWQWWGNGSGGVAPSESAAFADVWCDYWFEFRKGIKHG